MGQPVHTVDAAVAAYFPAGHDPEHADEDRPVTLNKPNRPTMQGVHAAAPALSE